MTPHAFVLMPFTEQFNQVYQSAIVPAVVSHGLQPQLAPDIRRSRDIMSNIYEGIWEGRVVIADLTGLNANVLYELGIASALNKHTALISQNIRKLAFNIRRDSVYHYKTDSGGLAALSQHLTEQLRIMLVDRWWAVPSWKEERNTDVVPVNALLWAESVVKKEVWVVEPEESFQDKAFHEVIMANLKRGIKYRFIVMDRQDVERAFVTTLGEFFGTRAEVVYVPERELGVPISLAIFDPTGPTECAYQYLPNGKTVYGIPLSDSALKRARLLFMSTWENKRFKRTA